MGSGRKNPSAQTLWAPGLLGPVVDRRARNGETELGARMRLAATVRFRGGKMAGRSGRSGANGLRRLMNRCLRRSHIDAVPIPRAVVMAEVLNPCTSRAR
jgi:hypothetical protein